MTELLRWLPLGAAVIAGGIAWGAQQQQIKSLEQAVATQAQLQDRQTDMRVQAARIEEHVEANERRLEEILRLLRER
ncbi:MAG: hypothetical protein KJP04_10700 [Arenicella sp.]|nr:hypothetical protein [Arenicella sp.]